MERQLERYSYGFSLIELMITLGILSILISLAVPPFSTFIASNRIESAAHLFQGALLQARSEALKRNAQVSVCASSNGATCSGGLWQNGWIVRVDSNGEVLQVHNGFDGLIFSSELNRISYWPDGTVMEVDQINVSSSSELGKERMVAITATGRVKVALVVEN